MKFVGSHDVMDWGPDDCCDHEDFDRDILTGSATCWRCGYRWHMTSDEIDRLQKAQAEYDELCEQWDRENSGLEGGNSRSDP